jgi:GNAT superfamily N-acetyltransferase
MRGQLARARAPRALPAGLVERCVVPGDGPALGRLMVDAYRGTVEDHGEDETWHRAEAAKTLEGYFGAVVWHASLVAIDAGNLAGACLVTDDGLCLLLAFAVVAPCWQGRGVGTALIVRSAQALLAAGHREWTLAVTAGNPARRLYERLGFVGDDSLCKTWPDRSG